MIVRVQGTLLSKDLDRIEVLTAGGVAYELHIPLGVYETLPRTGESVNLFTFLVVRDDGWQLFGFSSAFERRVFERLLGATGVGPALALGLLSSLSAERLVRAIEQKDVATLQGAPRVGRKKAERLILELGDKFLDVRPDGARPARTDGAAAEDAVRALVSLGYASGDAERAVRAALDDSEREGTPSAPELIRLALAKVTAGAGQR